MRTPLETSIAINTLMDTVDTVILQNIELINDHPALLTRLKTELEFKPPEWNHKDIMSQLQNPTHITYEIENNIPKIFLFLLYATDSLTQQPGISAEKHILILLVLNYLIYLPSESKEKENQLDQAINTLIRNLPKMPGDKIINAIAFNNHLIDSSSALTESQHLLHHLCFSVTSNFLNAAEVLSKGNPDCHKVYLSIEQDHHRIMSHLKPQLKRLLSIDPHFLSEYHANDQFEMLMNIMKITANADPVMSSHVNSLLLLFTNEAVSDKHKTVNNLHTILDIANKHNTTIALQDTGLQSIKHLISHMHQSQEQDHAHFNQIIRILRDANLLFSENQCAPEDQSDLTETFTIFNLLAHQTLTHPPKKTNLHARSRIACLIKQAETQYQQLEGLNPSRLSAYQSSLQTLTEQTHKTWQPLKQSISLITQPLWDTIQRIAYYQPSTIELQTLALETPPSQNKKKKKKKKKSKAKLTEKTPQPPHPTIFKKETPPQFKNETVPSLFQGIPQRRLSELTQIDEEDESADQKTIITDTFPQTQTLSAETPHACAQTQTLAFATQSKSIASQPGDIKKEILAHEENRIQQNSASTLQKYARAIQTKNTLPHLFFQSLQKRINTLPRELQSTYTDIELTLKLLMKIFRATALSADATLSIRKNQSQPLIDHHAFNLTLICHALSLPGVVSITYPHINSILTQIQSSVAHQLQLTATKKNAQSQPANQPANSFKSCFLIHQTTQQLNKEQEQWESQNKTLPTPEHDLTSTR